MTPREELNRIRKRQRLIGSETAWEILLDLADTGPREIRTISIGLGGLETKQFVERSEGFVRLTSVGSDVVARCLA